MGNPASQTFSVNGTFTPPAGVTQVQVQVQYQNPLNFLTKSSLTEYAISSLGQLYAWGDNSNGQLGDNTVVPKSSPVLVLGGQTFVKVQTVGSTGSTQSTYGLTNQGQLFAWGANLNGQLGIGNVAPRSTPIAVVGGLRFSDFYACCDGSAFYCLGLGQNGTLYGWGGNSQGQLGDNTNVDKSSPVAVVGGLRFQKIYTNGDNTSYGITSTGAVYGWGKNGSGRIGDGTITQRSSPVQVLGGLSFKKLAFVSGNVTSAVLGLTTTGQLYSWGGNSQGQLGIGNTNDQSSPVQVVGGRTFLDVNAGSNQGTVLAIDSTGTPFGWGRNNVGQVGVGVITDQSSPVQILGGLSFVKMYVSNQSSYGLTAAGVLYAWGSNNNGQLGDGTIANKSSPVQVLGGLTFQEYIQILTATASNGSNVAMGVTTQGTVYCWGINSSGALGDGTSANKSSPVQVLGGLDVQLNPPPGIFNIPVVPGTSYNVNMQQLVPTFGITPIGYGAPSSVTVYFEE